MSEISEDWMSMCVFEREIEKERERERGGRQLKKNVSIHADCKQRK